jgi:hypothetical protein
MTDPKMVVDEAHEKVELENEQVRVLRVKTGPREKRLARERPDRILVWLTDAHERHTSADGKSKEVRHEAGEVVFRPASTHALENLEGEAVELLVIELKRAR